MDQSSPQSTILVKKADGSTMRVPRHEVGVKPSVPATEPTVLPVVATPVTVVASAPRAQLPAWDKDDHVSLLDPALHESAPVAPAATATPVAAPPSSKKSIPELDRMIRASASESIGVRGIRSVGGTKAGVNDIRSAAPQPHRSMGPIDELRSFTLRDWRRIETPTTSATDAVWKKFADLQRESYLLFMDAIRAWHESPLYRMYLDNVTAALSEGVPLATVLGRKTSAEGMTMVECLAILDLNSRLT